MLGALHIHFSITLLFVSSLRTGSILSKDPPPDKKPKSDKPSLPCNDFDPTGILALYFSILYSLLFSVHRFRLCYTFHSAVMYNSSQRLFSITTRTHQFGVQ